MELASPTVPTNCMLRKFTEQLLHTWCGSCNAFLQWQHEEVLKKEPTAETRAQHRETLKWLLRAARRLHAEVADPDYPVPGYLPEVAGKLHQLESSWEMLYNNPLSDEEADAILQKCFPDEP